MSYSIEQFDKQVVGTTARIRYRLGFEQCAGHLLTVTMTIEAIDTPTVRIALPNWTPGSYKIRDYASLIGSMSVADEAGEPLPFRSIAKNRVEIETAGVHTVVVTYLYFAHERSVRHSHVDRGHAFIMPGTCLMYVPGRTDETHHVEIESRWPTITTSLSPVTHDGLTFGALNYDILVDSPIEIGDHFVGRYELFGAVHEVAITGETDLPHEWIVDRTMEIVEKGMDLWESIPYDRYVFILHMLPGEYGGLEHARAQVSVFDGGRLTELASVRKFLALVTHEYFHTWNVKRIRPIELGPFDYEVENYTSMLWLAEGATSYYDDLLSYRIGFLTRDDYLKTLSESHLATYFDLPGRLSLSIKESSFLSWVKLYLPNPDTGNRYPSYYLKGGILFLLLDLHIIDRSDATRSLDDGMRGLYARYLEDPSVGLTEGEFMTIVARETGVDVAESFGRWLDAVEEIPLQELLEPFGLRWERKREKKSMTFGEGFSLPVVPNTRTGIGVDDANDRLTITKVLAGSPAARAGLASGDEIISVNGLRVANAAAWKSIVGRIPAESEFEVVASSGGRLYTTTLRTEAAPSFHLEIDDDITPEQRRRLDYWLRRASRISEESTDRAVESARVQ